MIPLPPTPRRTPGAGGAGPAVFLAVLLTGCVGARVYELRMGDMHADIARMTGLEGDPLEKNKVRFVVTGKQKYDDFFKTAAYTRAGMVVAQALQLSATKNMKKYARSYVSAQAVDQGVKDILGDAKPEEMTDEQAFAIMRLKKQRGQLSADELNYFVQTSANLTQTALYLDVSVRNAGPMVESGSHLVSTVRSDFTGVEARRIPSVLAGLNESLGQVNASVAATPAMVKELVRLGQGIASITDGSAPAAGMESAAGAAPTTGATAVVSPSPPAFDVEAEYRSAVDLYSAGRYDESVGKISRVLHADKKHWRSWSLLGNCQYMKGDAKSALASYDYALVLNPDNPELRAWVGKIRAGQ